MGPKGVQWTTEVHWGGVATDALPLMRPLGARSLARAFCCYTTFACLWALVCGFFLVDRL